MCAFMHRRRTRAFILTSLAALALMGCHAPMDTPRTRFGSLPFPGVASLFAAADPANLAPHYYRPRYQRPFSAEGDRGIVFTRQAGFIDISHAREAMDWTRYISVTLAQTPPQDGQRIARFAFENLVVEVITPDQLPDDQRIDIAGAMAYRLVAWHEISTWMGYSLVPFVSERRSSFTPDDLTAHAIGVRVATNVLRQSHDLQVFEELAGEELEQAVEALEPLSPAELAPYCQALQDVWWRGAHSLVVDANLGLSSGRKIPLVPSPLDGTPVAGMPLRWTDDLSAPMYRLHVQGSVRPQVKALLHTTTISADEQLTRLAAHVAHALSGERTIVFTDASADEPRHAAANP